MKFFTRIILLVLFLSCWSCGHKEHEADHDEDHHESSGIEISKEKAEEFGLMYETVSPGKFNDVIKTSGLIEAAGADMINISAKRSGIITLTDYVNQGSVVKAGERIGVISTDGVQGGDVNSAASANLKAAKAEYERLKPLFEENLVTASTFREAERAYREAEALAGKSSHGGSEILTTAVGGVIQNLYVRSGDYVETGDPIATVAKNSTQILKADLPSREAIHLPEIETAYFSTETSDEVFDLADFNGKKISGNSNASTGNGYIPVYFSFSGNPLSTPGGYAEVFLVCGERDNVISVPRSALIELQGNKYLYVTDGGETYEKRLVKTGASDGLRVEIKEGLTEGETVVTKGASIVRMAEMSAVAPPSHTHNH